MQLYLLILIVFGGANALDECPPDCKCNGKDMICRHSGISGEGLPYIPTYIERVKIEGYNVPTLKYHDLKGRRNLKRVTLRNNAISVIEINALDDLIHLEHLDLSDNHLSQLPENVHFSNRQLKTLRVANNVHLTFSLAKLPGGVETLNAYNTTFVLTQRMWDEFPQIKAYTGNICRDSKSSALLRESTDNFWAKDTTPATKKPVVENLKPEIRSDEVKCEPAASNWIPWSLFVVTLIVLAGKHVWPSIKGYTDRFQKTGKDTAGEVSNPLQPEPTA